MNYKFCSRSMEFSSVAGVCLWRGRRPRDQGKETYRLKPTPAVLQSDVAAGVE